MPTLRPSRERGHADHGWLQSRHSFSCKAFPEAGKRGRLRLVASRDGAEGSVRLNADAASRIGLFDGDERAGLALDPRREACVHLVRGALEVDGQPSQGGDAALIAQESRLGLRGGRDAEVRVFDLAA